jgi:hypothetical protein
MALFRRRSTPADEPGADLAGGPDDRAPELDLDEGDELDLDVSEAIATGAAAADRPSDRQEGPFDESEADLADQSIPRLDLGSLLIPGLPGVGVQVEADPNTQEVRAITAVLGTDAAVQVQAFAAPRSEGVWDEIRAEMLAELSAAAGAQVVEQEGAFGPELRAVVPARSPEGAQVQQPLRFTGIDGPRWFVRAVFLGRAALEPDPQDALHTLVRQMIVVRGPEAMAPRDPLPLRLPEAPPDGMVPADALGEPGPADDGIDELDDEVDDELDDEDPDQEPGRFAGIDPFERGPEITEIR